MTRVPFNHVRTGSGEPLVLIHGIGHHLQGWDPVVALLKDGFTTYAVDSPGFGQSAALAEDLRPDVNAYTDAFIAWFAELGLDRPHVAGNSMGGGIALELARRGAVRSACAISPVGFWTKGEREMCQHSLTALAKLPAGLRPAVLRLAGTKAGATALAWQLFSRPWRTPAQELQATLTDAWNAPAFDAALEAFNEYDFRNGDELDGTPVTVAWGSRDFLLPYWRQAPRARAALPAAEHVTLRGLGHTPYYDDPGMVAAVVRRAAQG